MLNWGEAFGISVEGKTTISKFSYDVSQSAWAFGLGDGLYVVPGRSGGQWKVVILPLNESSKDSKVELVPGTMVVRNGLPHSFSITVTRAGHTEKLRLRHSDRFDREGLEVNEKIHLNAGYYPTTMVGLIGSVGCGKSCLHHCMRTSSTLNRLRKLFPGNAIRSTGVESVSSRLQRTAIGTFEGAPFEIEDKAGHRREVVLYDMAGEITNLEAFSQSIYKVSNYRMEDRIEADKILDKVQYLDAIFVVIKGTSLFKTHERVIGDVDSFLRLLDEEYPSSVIRKAIVITEADLIRQRLKDAEAAIQESDATNRQILRANGALANGAFLHSSSSLFQRANSFEDIYRHVALCTEFHQDIKGGDSSRAPCFMISTLQERDDGMLDFEQAVNAEIPFAWLLSRMIKMEVEHG